MLLKLLKSYKPMTTNKSCRWKTKGNPSPHQRGPTSPHVPHLGRVLTNLCSQVLCTQTRSSQPSRQKSLPFLFHWVSTSQALRFIHPSSLPRPFTGQALYEPMQGYMHTTQPCSLPEPAWLSSQPYEQIRYNLMFAQCLPCTNINSMRIETWSFWALLHPQADEPWHGADPQ